MASFEQRGSSVRVIVRLPGGGKLTATRDTMTEARAWAFQQERLKATGLLTTESLCEVTVGEAFESYQSAVGSKTDSAKWNGLRVAKFCKEPIAKMNLSKVTTHDINLWINDRVLVVTGSTVNRELTLMSGAFNYAVKDRRWITVNPCHGARHPEQGRPRDRPLRTEAELAAICASTGYDTDPGLLTKTARVGACFLLALETGIRSGEILRALPSDYWKSAKTLHIGAREKGGRKGAKSGRTSTDPSRDVPLTARAMEILDQLMVNRIEGSKYIVGLSDGQRDALWRKARDRSGVEDLTFHDSKHEAATRLSRFLDVTALSHAIGTKDLRLLRDTYYIKDASRLAALLPDQLTPSQKNPA